MPLTRRVRVLSITLLTALMGTLAAADQPVIKLWPKGLPADARGILVGLQVRYVKKARGRLSCRCRPVT